MMLLDTNIIIYATRPRAEPIRESVELLRPYVSAVRYVEALGYHALTDVDREALEQCFRDAVILPLDDPVLRRAVRLRKMRRMGLGDALIAGTALAHGLTLVTRNTADFRRIGGLQLWNPFESPHPPEPTDLGSSTP